MALMAAASDGTAGRMRGVGMRRDETGVSMRGKVDERGLMAGDNVPLIP